jgi:tyrosine-protein kinase Etk/Wzc
MDHKKNKEISIKELINPYLKKWKYFVGMIFLMLILAVYYIKSTPQIYMAQASVLIKDAKKSSPAVAEAGMLESLGGLSGMGTNSIENEIGIFRSKTIVEDVVRDYNFQTPLYAEQTLKSIELYGATSPYIINVIQEKKTEELSVKPIYIKTKGNTIILSSEGWDNNITTSFGKTTNLPFAMIMIRKNPEFKVFHKTETPNIYFTYSDFESTVNDFQKELKVELLDKEGTMINLSVNFENKAKAKDFLNSLIRQYNYYAINDKNIESKRTKDFVDKRIVLISKELGDVETQKEGYKTSNNIVNIGSEAGMNLQMREQSKAQVMEIGTQLELNKILQSSLKRKGVGDVLPLNIGLESEAAGKAIQEYNALVLQRNKYLQEATPDHPIVKAANKEIEEMKSSLMQSLQRNVTSLELAKRKVESQLGASEQVIGKIPSQEKMFRSIERQQQIKESLYLLLLQKREEAAISMEVISEKARVIDRAFVLKKPVAPNKILILGIALLLGLLIPLAFIYIKRMLKSTIDTRNDIATLTDLPVIAEIPKLKNRENPLIAFNDVSPMAEAFRIFVTNLKFLITERNEPQVIMVTSSVKGEGKTFISTNLSLILASARDKVLVIGADIRNPQLQRYNPSMKSAKGLTEFLSGEEITLNDMINPSGYNANCDFIYSGAIPPNPTDLLQNGRLQELLHLIKSQNNYKYIVLDTAPLLLVTDSFLIANQSDVIIYVTRSEVTEGNYIEFLNHAVADNKLKNVGIILNEVKENNFGYGNKYGYGYSAQQKKWWQF